MSEIKVGEKVLLVDDEANVLAGYVRQLRKSFNLDTALSGTQALEMMGSGQTYAVVVSDLKMPGLDGIAFLSRVREASPDSVRIMLTGYADVTNAIAAVNQGNVFRFLTKPCQADQLTRALVDGIRQYRLVTAERELLEKTLQGSIKLVTEVFSLVEPESFGRASRLTHYMRQIIQQLGGEAPWEFITAAMLCQLGYLTLPAQVRRKLARRQALSEEENLLYENHPGMAAQLISSIPRLEAISQIIAYQEKGFDGSGIPKDGPCGADLPLGSRILKVLLDFDSLVSAGESKGRALVLLRQRQGLYDPVVLTALSQALGEEADYDHLMADVYQLKEGMVLADDLLDDKKGRLLLAKGHAINATIIHFIRNYNRVVGVRQPIKVLVPLKPDAVKS